MTEYFHHVPGRLRVRAPVFRRDTPARRQAIRELVAQAGILSVRLNAKAGSVTVLYDVQETGVEAIVDHFRRYDCWASPAAAPPAPVKTPAVKAAPVAAVSSLLGPMVGKAALSMLVNKGVSASLSSLLGTRI